VKLGELGIEAVYEIELQDAERAALQASAADVKANQAKLAL
jgi:malate/lactate dehydrogenase